LATGPAAWGPWKAGLVHRLVTDATHVLAGRPPPPPAALGPEQLALLASGTLQLMADGGRLTVAAPDRAGLLSVVAGVLTLAGVTIRSATTSSDAPSGMALLRFEVAPAFDALPDWSRVSASLEAALDGRLPLDTQLEEREANYARYRRPTAAAAPAVRVAVDNSASTSASIVEVRAPDRGPVLYQVTHALTSCDVTITCALVSTLGAEAIDVFYVQKLEGGRVTDPAHLQQIQLSIEEALAP
jgi:[protein-PII] uridylyltransferase